jgi:uncharacterized protein
VSAATSSEIQRPGIFARALLIFIRAYQAILAPMNFSGCKFYPSCSRYGYEAIQRYGARRGSWLALKRLLRCRPFTRGGFDPVPDLEPHSHSSEHCDSSLHGQEFAK